YAKSLLELGRNAAALKEFKSVNKKKPSAEVVANLAELYIQDHKPKHAVDVIEDSKFRTDSKVKNALVKAKLEIGELDYVEKEISQLISKDKTNADLYYIKGMVLYKRSNYSKAKREFDRALGLKARFPGAIYQLGMCELKLRKWQKAVFPGTEEPQAGQVESQGAFWFGSDFCV
ncbi:tetratricopeptide repeat protein, partial [Fibrobacterota bacterium]